LGFLALATGPAAGFAVARSNSQDFATASGYAWPVQPFEQAHPIRSTFGDPRTWFDGPPTPATLYSGSGSFTFHDGVDIVAPDHTAVYPVRSGVARLSGGRTVIVKSGDGTTWEYWHIVPAVGNGDQVVAYRTVLGRIRTAYGHVHFTERRNGKPVNPLARGHLTPYDDHTAPSLGPIEFRRPGATAALVPTLVRGEIELVVPARDQPKPHASGRWARMQVAPAFVSWHVERAGDGHVVLTERPAFDVRSTLPANGLFWQFYARGTRQNMATFKLHRYWRDEGVFLFRLGVLDTRRLHDGIYTIVATARDIRANSSTTRLTFLIWNRAGWPPPTVQS